MEGWQPEGSEAIAFDQLRGDLAIRFVKHVSDHCGDFAELKESRVWSESEIVTFGLITERPQRPVYAIAPVEIVSICFFFDINSAPAILIARSDFPDTPHQNLPPEGFPCQICIDDRPWDDARASYSAAELMIRISSWFSKAGLGELHDARQPIDPVFFGANTHEIIFSKAADDAISQGKRELVLFKIDDDARHLFVVPSGTPLSAKASPNLVLTYCSVRPEKMTRLRQAPKTLGSLARFLNDRGVNFLELLGASILGWQATSSGTVGPSKSLFCILVNMPILHPLTQENCGSNLVAFISNMSVGEIGEKLGYLFRNTSGTANQLSYAIHIKPAPSLDGADEIPINPALVHADFSADLAASLAGKLTANTKKLLMIGAGSLGSGLAECLVREGLFKWVIIDCDVLLPHNLSRHTLAGEDVATPKALALARRISQIRYDADARGLVDNVLRPTSPESLDSCFRDAEIVLDASASVTVARAISDRPESGRRVSAFFTPNGTSAVLMVEDESRKETLREIEAAYLREVLVNPMLSHHMGKADDMPYTGACRATTNKIPSSSAQLLSGLIARAISLIVEKPNAALKIWQLGDDGSVFCSNPQIETTKCELGGWCVVFPASLREDLIAERKNMLPNETGGALLGMVHQEKKRIDVIHGLRQPEDSKGTQSGFTRGTKRLRKVVGEMIERSGNQVRYIGEWHSHPKGSRAFPSGTDLNQIGELTLILDQDEVPALSLIVAEGEISFVLGRLR
jgi:Prokaryotic E2 family A/ThiF family/Prokaryotic homologs of the JAB domain